MVEFLSRQISIFFWNDAQHTFALLDIWWKFLNTTSSNRFSLKFLLPQKRVQPISVWGIFSQELQKTLAMGFIIG